MRQKDIDVFISYSSKDKVKVDDIVNAMERRGIKCWYAPRDIKESSYVKAITKAIKSSKIFLLCLSYNSAVSEHVLNEVEFAYKRRKNDISDIQISPLLVEDIDIDASELDEIMYYIRRSQFITISDAVSSMGIADLIINKHRDTLKLNASKPIRDESKYHIVQNSEEEIKRLKIQNELTKRFDGEIYKEIFSISNIDVLDVGCGDGDIILDRLETYASQYRLCAFDRDNGKIKLAQRKYSNSNTLFFCLDITEKNFEKKLKEKCSELGVESFDVIHISMILLHLKNPVYLLRILRRYLKPTGVIFIKDIDDGINFAYPDEDGAFDRICKICSRSELSGFRHSGRQIYHYLTQSGYKDISLKKQGLWSGGFTYDEKDNFFNMYCRFIFDDIEWMHNKYPDNKQFEEDNTWYKENYDLIYDRFMKDDFVFCLGFQIYIARKVVTPCSDSNVSGFMSNHL